MSTHPLWRGAVSALALRTFVDELHRRGHDPRSALGRAGLVATDADDPFGRVRRQAFFTFCEAAADETRDPAFHLHAVANARVGAFGATDFIAMMAPTVGLGLSRAAAAYPMIDEGVRPVPVVGRDTVTLRLEPALEARPHAIDVESLAVGVACRIHAVTRGAHGLARLTFAARDPGYRSTFEALVRCPIDYDAGVDAIVLGRATWDARPASSHPTIVDLVTLVTEPVLSAILPSPGLVPSVERLVAERLPDGGLTAAQAASVLGLSERTLHRKLGREGRSFGDIVEAVRRRIAEERLAEGRHTIAQIADALGYAEPGAFTRAFRRWTGRSPSSRRAAMM